MTVRSYQNVFSIASQIIKMSLTLRISGALIDVFQLPHFTKNFSTSFYI